MELSKLPLEKNTREVTYRKSPAKQWRGREKCSGASSAILFLSEVYTSAPCNPECCLPENREMQERLGRPMKRCVCMCAHKAVAAVLAFTWPTKSLVSLSMSFWFYCFAWNLHIQHTRLKLTGHNTKQCKERNLSNKNSDHVSLGRKTEC